MDDTLAVDIGERGGELPAYLAHLAGIERTLADSGRKCRPVDQLENDVEIIAVLARVEHRHEVRMGESRQHPGFSVKATSIQRRAAAMNLDRDSPMQHLVVRGEHRSHATVREELLEAVTPSEDRPDGDHHAKSSPFRSTRTDREPIDRLVVRASGQ